MKKLTVVLAIAVIIFSSCKKEKPEPIDLTTPFGVETLLESRDWTLNNDDGAYAYAIFKDTAFFTIPLHSATTPGFTADSFGISKQTNLEYTVYEANNTINIGVWYMDFIIIDISNDDGLYEITYQDSRDEAIRSFKEIKEQYTLEYIGEDNNYNYYSYN